MVMRFVPVRNHYLNGLPDKLVVAVTEYPFGSGVYQYDFAMTPSKYYAFGCIFKKRCHVFQSEHQYLVSMSNNVNIIKYQLRNGGSFVKYMGQVIREIILLRGSMLVEGCLFLLCENFSL